MSYKLSQMYSNVGSIYNYNCFPCLRRTLRGLSDAQFVKGWIFFTGGVTVACGSATFVITEAEGVVLR